jgi:hypothetical protein
MAKISLHGGPTNGEPDPVEPEVATPEPVEDASSVDDEDVPDGVVDEVITWTEADAAAPARLLRALAAEQEKPNPRVTLLVELKRRLAL